MQVQVPMSIIRDLKCRHCASFVSCGPVFVVPDGGILCGRCNMIAKPQFRNAAYETLAGCFLFPCHNWSNYCNKQLQWNEAIVHEEGCTYRSKCQLFCNHPALFCKPERKASVHDDFQLQHVPDQKLLYLECHTCGRYLSCDPVYIGEDGNNICHRCIHNNGIPRGVLRNLAYEKLASFTIFPCIYKNRGCTMRLPFGRELWRHEDECSYGNINNLNNKNSSKSKKHIGAAKERGVVMTHSGHIYATITPHSALWTPPQPEKDNETNIEVNREFCEMVKKNGPPMDYPESPVEEKYDSLISTVASSRKTSMSSDAGRKHTGENTPSRVNSPQNQFFGRDNPVRQSYGKTENYPRYSVQYNHGHGEEMARPSLPGNMVHYKNNLNYINSYSHNENDEAEPKSLEYRPSLSVSKPLPSEYIQPKRGDSFRVGNQQIIDELRIRQKLKKKSVESDGDSVISEGTLESIENNDNNDSVFMENPKVPVYM